MSDSGRSSTPSTESLSSNTSSRSETEVFHDPSITMTLEGIIDSVVVANISGTILFANTATETMFGYPKEGLKGQNVMMFMPEPWKSHHHGFMSAYTKV